MVLIFHIHALGDELVRVHLCVWKRPQFYCVTLRPSIALSEIVLEQIHFYKYEKP